MKVWELKTRLLGRGLVTVEGKIEEDGWITFRDPLDTDEVLLRVKQSRAEEIAGWSSHRQRGLNMVLSFRESFSGVEVERNYSEDAKCIHCGGLMVCVGDDFIHSIPYCPSWRRLHGA